MKTISKKKVLEAIKKEPLKGGQWVNVDKKGNVSKDPNCKVCAVGAVLRNAGYSNKRIDNFGIKLVNSPYDVSCYYTDSYRQEEVIEKLLKEEAYLHALSVKFETLSSEKFLLRGSGQN